MSAPFDPQSLMARGQQRRQTERVSQAGSGIMNELVKSFGFRIQDGNVDWSLQNIGEAFEEDPIWTALDYLTLFAAPAKMGVAAVRAAKGTGAFAHAYRAGDISLRQFQKLSPARPFGGAFTSPTQAGMGALGDDAAAIINKYGHNPAEARGIAQALENESTVARNAMNRMAEDMIGTWDKVSPEMRAKGKRFLESPVADPTKYGQQLQKALGREGFAAYEKTWHFRNSVHEELYGLGLISKETYERNLKRYAPRVYEEFVEAETRAGGTTGLSAGLKRFIGRRPGAEEQFTDIMDPRVSIAKISEAYGVALKQKFAQGLGNSVIAKTADDVGTYIQRYAGDAKLREAMGIGDDALRAAQAGNFEQAAKLAGWERFDDLAKKWGGGQIPGYLERLPGDLREKWVDPHAVSQVAGVLQTFQKAPPNRFVETLSRAYNHSLGFFRAGKTAYNPATHARNFIGNIVFHNLATSGFKLAPTQGIKAYREGGRAYREAVESGVLGTSFSVEIREAAAKAMDEGSNVGPNAMSWLGESKTAQWIQKAGAKAEDIYAAEDEVWKLDAFLDLKKKGLARGMSNDKAVEYAATEVAKYMPSFMFHSPFGEMTRKAIPFASFTTEAVRVWKNAIVEKPALAFMWNHMAEGMTQVAGAYAGFSPDEVEAAREALPHYQQGKKMALLPFRVGGKPSFLDLSYMIPMANISEAEEAENLFFGALYDPTSNPILNVTIAATTGRDPFTRREVEPQRFEQMTGMAVEQPHMRRLIGLGEHMAAVMAPPLAPPGYAGMNLVEYAKGLRHGDTGELLEPDLGRTLAANLAGLRSYEASPTGQTINVRHEERERNQKLRRWRKRWKTAMANNQQDMARAAEDEIYALKEEAERGSGADYIRRLRTKGLPGQYTQMSTRQLEEVVRRTRRIGLSRLPANERRQFQAMQRELLKRRRNRR